MTTAAGSKSHSPSSAELDLDEIDSSSDEMIAERRAGAPGGGLPQDCDPLTRRTVTAIETLSLWSGRLLALLLVPLLLSIVFEVLSRNAINRPTYWAYDISRWTTGFMFMAAAAYALWRGVHIRADFLYRNWSRATQALVDGWLYVLLFFPSMLFFFWVTVQFVEKAWTRGELNMDTAWMAPLGPVLTGMPLGASLLLFQGVAELLRCASDLRGWQRQLFRGLSALFLFLALLTLLDLLQMLFGAALPFFAKDAGWLTPFLLLANLLAPAGALFDAVMSQASDGLNLLRGLGGIDEVWIGGVMIAVMLFAIFVGFPISFTLIFLGIIFGSWGFGTKMVTFLQGLWFSSTMQDEQLVAVPLFILMGIMMEQAGVMERLFQAIRLAFARLNGALFIAVLLVSTIFAAATGIVGASVTILGIMAAKTMSDSGYNVRLSAGAITAGGTLGILIPPSIMLVVMGPVLEIPVTELFNAALIPGVVMALLYIGYTMLRSYLNPSLGPKLPPEQRAPNALFVLKELALGMVPPAALIAATLGSILAGFATPAEASACGALGAILLVVFYGKFRVGGLWTAMIKTLEISVLILFLVAASNFFGATFSRLGTPVALTEFLLTLDLNVYLLLTVIMLVVFLLGWPLEWVPIVLIIVPILVPLLVELEVNLLWFAILVAVNLQTAWISPPVALSAYFLKSVVPQWDLKDIYLGMMQFMVIQVLGLILFMLFPRIVLWLPDRLGGDFGLQAIGKAVTSAVGG